MRKKIIFLVLVLCLFLPVARAQQAEVTIKSFTQTIDHIPSSDRRNDRNGDPCALVKVQVLDDVERVEGGRIGQIIKKGNVEKWVYMCKGAVYMKIHFKNHLPINVQFKKYGINKLESNRVYELIVETPNSPGIVQGGTSGAPIMQKLIINYTPSNATVLIDSKVVSGSGHIETLLPVGEHNYIIAAEGYVTVEGVAKLNGQAPRVITENLVSETPVTSNGQQATETVVAQQAQPDSHITPQVQPYSASRYEGNAERVRLTMDGDNVCMPQVYTKSGHLVWFTSRILDVTGDGANLAFLAYDRKGATNIFLKSLNNIGFASSGLFDNRHQSLVDFSYSPDGRYMCFTEKVKGNHCISWVEVSNIDNKHQITSQSKIYSPVFSSDMSQIFYTAEDKQGVTIWRYNIREQEKQKICLGMNPCPVRGENALLCVRPSSDTGLSEIWKIDYSTGSEVRIISHSNKGFTTPAISPGGQWIVVVGSSVIQKGKKEYQNTDLYVCRADGSGLTQLTTEETNEVSPVWSPDGRYIYFISQSEGSKSVANVYRMNFNQ